MRAASYCAVLVALLTYITYRFVYANPLQVRTRATEWLEAVAPGCRVEVGDAAYGWRAGMRLGSLAVAGAADTGAGSVVVDAELRDVRIEPAGAPLGRPGLGPLPPLEAASGAGTVGPGPATAASDSLRPAPPAWRVSGSELVVSLLDAVGGKRRQGTSWRELIDLEALRRELRARPVELLIEEARLEPDAGPRASRVLAPVRLRRVRVRADRDAVVAQAEVVPGGSWGLGRLQARWTAPDDGGGSGGGGGAVLELELDGVRDPRLVERLLPAPLARRWGELGVSGAWNVRLWVRRGAALPDAAPRRADRTDGAPAGDRPATAAGPGPEPGPEGAGRTGPRPEEPPERLPDLATDPPAEGPSRAAGGGGTDAAHGAGSTGSGWTWRAVLDHRDTRLAPAGGRVEVARISGETEVSPEGIAWGRRARREPCGLELWGLPWLSSGAIAADGATVEAHLRLLPAPLDRLRAAELPEVIGRALELLRARGAASGDAVLASSSDGTAWSGTFRIERLVAESLLAGSAQIAEAVATLEGTPEGAGSGTLRLAGISGIPGIDALGGDARLEWGAGRVEVVADRLRVATPAELEEKDGDGEREIDGDRSGALAVRVGLETTGAWDVHASLQGVPAAWPLLEVAAIDGELEASGDTGRSGAAEPAPAAPRTGDGGDGESRGAPKAGAGAPQPRTATASRRLGGSLSLVRPRIPGGVFGEAELEFEAGSARLTLRDGAIGIAPLVLVSPGRCLRATARIRASGEVDAICVIARGAAAPALAALEAGSGIPEWLEAAGEEVEAWRVAASGETSTATRVEPEELTFLREHPSEP